MNLPQNITSRYTRNLLVSGFNNEFLLRGVNNHPLTVGNDIVGHYYSVAIQLRVQPDTTVDRRGATPEEALVRCLQAFGITFAH